MQKHLIVGPWKVAIGRLKQWYAAFRGNDAVYERGRNDESDGWIHIRLGREQASFERLLKCGRAVSRI